MPSPVALTAMFSAFAALLGICLLVWEDFRRP